MSGADAKLFALEAGKYALAVIVGVAVAAFATAMYLNRYALAADLEAHKVESAKKLGEHDVQLGRFDEDLHWIMDRLDGLSPPRPTHSCQ